MVHFIFRNKTLLFGLQIINQRDAEGFYLDKQKGFVPKKLFSVPCTMDSSFFSQQMAP